MEFAFARDLSSTRRTGRLDDGCHIDWVDNWPAPGAVTGPNDIPKHEAGCRQARPKLLPSLLAYRIHVSRSTAQMLRSLDEGYRIDIRGQTEIKVRGLALLELMENPVF